jgi:GntR family transcriptional regulator
MPTITRKNGLPAYKQIQDSIIKRIERGELKPGDAVDSERLLARIHDVSLMTARHALVGLEREGLVERRHGAGTFVAAPKIHFNKLMSFSEQLAGRSLSSSSRVVSMKITDDEPEIAARLSLPIGSRLLKLERVRIGSDEPFAVETSYLSAESFRGLSRPALERGSLFTLLEREFNVTIAHADEEIDCFRCTRAIPFSEFGRLFIQRRAKLSCMSSGCIAPTGTCCGSGAIANPGVAAHGSKRRSVSRS